MYVEEEQIQGIPVVVGGGEKYVRIYGNGETSAKILFNEEEPCVGMTFDVTTAFVNDSEDSCLAWQFPANAALVENSVTVNGDVVEYQVLENGILLVDTDIPEGSVRFTVNAVSEGEGSVVAGLFADGSFSVLDERSVNIEAIVLGLPNKTGRTTLVSRGKSIPGGTITLYDNGKKAGSAQINFAGQFQAELKLAGTGREHAITAVIMDENGKRITAQPTIIEYDPGCAEVASVVITNIIHDDNGLPVEQNTVLDFLNPPAYNPYIAFWPDYPTFTFEMEMVNCVDPLGLGQVYLLTNNRMGNETRIQVLLQRGSCSQRKARRQ